MHECFNTTLDKIFEMLKPKCPIWHTPDVVQKSPAALKTPEHIRAHRCGSIASKFLEFRLGQ